ncbi:MAG: hypothetical protein KJZ54_05395 [Phycisphaerales bacterium]|nr:hypothetical protein [Phycisphaerales bacterium]
MSPHYTRLAIVAVAAGLAIGVLAYVRLTRLSPETDPQRFWMAEGERVYSRFSALRLNDPAVVTRVVASAVVEDPEELSARVPNAVAQIRDEVARLLIARMSAQTADEYVSTLTEYGYRLKATEEFESRYGPLARLAQRCGANGEEPIVVLRALWMHEPSRRALPVEMCTDTEAAIITFARTTRDHFVSRYPAGGLGSDLWLGRSSAACRFWMQPAVMRQQVVAKHGETIAAQAGFIVGVVGSQRRPLMISLFYDPDTSRWWIDGVSVQNYIGSDTAWTCTEF